MAKRIIEAIIAALAIAAITAAASSIVQVNVLQAKVDSQKEKIDNQNIVLSEVQRDIKEILKLLGGYR